MGSYNIIMFLALIAGSGLFWLVGLLFCSGIVDAANVLINMGIMSTYTAGTLETVLTLFHLCLPLVLIVLVIWFVSSAVSEGERM